MKKIKLSEGVYTVELENEDEEIYWGASFFDDCDLVELHIPQGVRAIAAHGLSYCNRLARVYMPECVSTLGDAMFYGVTQPIQIFYDGSSERFAELGASRKVIKPVQVPGKYDHQPYCNSEGTYYVDQTVIEQFDGFCAECEVICADGKHLYYGYKKPRKT